MSYSKGKKRLQGFNNLTKMVSFNLYDFVVARTPVEREGYQVWLDEHFQASKITAILTKVASIIDAEILSVSDQDYHPHGASSVVLVGDGGYSGEGPEVLGHAGDGHAAVSERGPSTHGADAESPASRVDVASPGGRVAVGAHLDKSHICAHTYPDWTDPNGVCSVRLDINIATCGEIVPLRALDYLLRTLSNDVVIIDYMVRGFTRDPSGKRIYMDHELRSIQDYIAQDIKSRYDMEDLVLQNEHIWQTKMLVKKLQPAEFFRPGTDPDTEDNKRALDAVRREMLGVFYGWPS
jgi:S-adenosylmethionine decarboxylase